MLFLGKGGTGADSGAQQSEMLSEGKKMSFSLSLENIQGEKKSFEAFRGKVVLINFWAAWCAPCLHEMPGIYKLQERWKERGFVVLGVSMDNDANAGTESLKRIAGVPPFEIIKGIDSSISSLFPIEGLPYSVIIDREGVIRFARSGEADWQSPEANKWIERLL